MAFLKTRRFFSALSFSLVGTALLLGGVSAVAAQATPAASGASGSSYPVTIDRGTCEQPTAQSAYQLDSTAPVGAGTTDAIVLGQPLAESLLTASATIDTTLEEIANGGNVIAIRASVDDYGTVVACGQIAGLNVDGTLAIAVRPVGASTVAGIATLTEGGTGLLGLGGDQIQVTVYIVAGSATPLAAPTPTT